MNRRLHRHADQLVHVAGENSGDAPAGLVAQLLAGQLFEDLADALVGGGQIRFRRCPGGQGELEDVGGEGTVGAALLHAAGDAATKVGALPDHLAGEVRILGQEPEGGPGPG
jgi:hypothetical protein